MLALARRDAPPLDVRASAVAAAVLARDPKEVVLAHAGALVATLEAVGCGAVVGAAGSLARIACVLTRAHARTTHAAAVVGAALRADGRGAVAARVAGVAGARRVEAETWGHTRSKVHRVAS